MKVILVASMSADGFIAQEKEQSSLDWTSKEDTKFFVQKSKEIRTLIMGSTTFETINPKFLPFKDRSIIVLTKSKTYSQYDSKAVRTHSGQPQEVLADLQKAGVNKVLIAGGSSVYSQFMQARLIDEMYLTIEPIIFGSGIKLFSNSVPAKLNLVEIIDLTDQTKVFHFKVLKD
jgi:dihydrofolate reductase